jgi:hypothetical protein
MDYQLTMPDVLESEDIDVDMHLYICEILYNQLPEECETVVES